MFPRSLYSIFFLSLPPHLPPPHTLLSSHQSFEFDVYLHYAENYMEALAHLHQLMEEDEVVKHFESQPINLFKEAMQYLLPKSLLEPIYHCFYYFEVLDVSSICNSYMYSSSSKFSTSNYSTPFTEWWTIHVQVVSNFRRRLSHVYVL